MKLFITMV